MNIINDKSPTPPLSPPVLFLVFNRLEYTKKSLAQIQIAQPEKIYIAADGPRKNVEGEAKIVQAVRDYILNNITWKCRVKTLFRDKNLGVGVGISEAISWFFDQEEAGIILEDDCVVSQSFFPFCSIMLEKYKTDDRIMMISGINYLNLDFKESYFFSRFCHIWGWATWKRAWAKFCYDIGEWKYLDKKVYRISPKFLVNFFYNYHFKLKNQKKINSWDIAWFYACCYNYGLSIVPSKNMVTNIGVEGVHAKYKIKNNFLKRYEIDNSKIIHPTKIYPNQEYENEFNDKEKFYYLRLFIKSYLEIVTPNFLISFYKKIRHKIYLLKSKN